jgi:hypothetical protein
MTSPPVLLLVFNRPEVAARLLDAVRAARPERLFIAADGPRPHRPDDVVRCEATRRVFDAIDWPCRVEKLFRDDNAGLDLAVISGISWFFTQVDAGVILEDDCLPAAEFFPYANELLERYAGNERVMHISGLNMRPDVAFTLHSYFFARAGHIWGWATWRRAWERFDREMPAWPAMRDAYTRSASPLQRALRRKFAAAYAGRKRTWARVWYYSVARHDGLAVVPSTNLVRNIGFDGDATNTQGGTHPLRIERTGRLTFPLDHPTDLTPNAAYERLLARYHRGSYLKRAREFAGWAVGRSRLK